MLLEQLFANSTIDIPQMLEHLKQTADSLGLAFGERKHTYNSRLAQELGLWAQSIDRGHDFHMAAFRAYFADGKNLGHKDVLIDIADSLGLPKAEAEDVITKRTFSPQVDSDWELSRKLGVTAVPTFVMNNDKIVGAQPYNDLERFVLASGAKSRGF